MQIGQLEIQLMASIARLQRDMDNAQRVVGDATTRLAKMADFAKGALGMIGGAISVGALVSSINDAITVLGDLDGMAQKTGASIENLSRLQKVATVFDEDMGKIDAAVVKLAKGLTSFDEEGSKARKGLGALGISARDSAGQLRDPAEVMIEMAQRLQNYKDGAAKTALINDVLGKSGADLLPYLNDLAENYDKVAAESAGSASAAAALQDQMGWAKLRVKELSGVVAAAAVPAINDLFGAIVDVTKAQKGMATPDVRSWADDLAVGIARVADVAALLPTIFGAVTSSFKVVIADVEVLSEIAKLRNPANVALEYAKGNDPMAAIKKAVAERNKVLEEANQKYDDLWNKPANLFEQAVLKRIGERGKAAPGASQGAHQSDLNYDSASDEANKAREKALEAAAKFIEAQKKEREEIGLTQDKLYILNATRAAAAAPLREQREVIMANARAILTERQVAEAARVEKERYDAAVKAGADARLQERLGAQQAVDQAQREMDTYGMGAAAITRYTIAKLEEKKAALMLAGAYGKEIEQLDFLIAKNGELMALQDQKDSLDSMFETTKVETFGQALREAFGEAGNSLAQLGSTLQDYMDKQDAADKARAKAKLKYAGDDKKIAQEIGKVNALQERERIAAYGNMAGAAKGFFKEKTVGYKVLEAAERGFRVYELAMTAQTMLAKLTAAQVTTVATVTGNAAAAASATASAATQVAANMAVGASAAAVGVATQAKGDPYSAWARMAAMAAVMASLGFAVAGGRSSKPNMQSAAEVQKTQGAGSVFGDADAKSESIKRSLELLEENSDLMLPLTQGMLASLRGIEAAMGGLTNLIVRAGGVTTGDNMGISTASAVNGGALGKLAVSTSEFFGGIGPMGAIMGKLASFILGETKKEIIDAGIKMSGAIGGLQGGSGFQQYATLETTKKSWFGLKKDVDTSKVYQGLDNELTQQFSLIFTNLEATMREAAPLLGKNSHEVGAAIKSLVIDTGVSLKGLKGEELTAAINSVISKAMDQVAEAAFPGMTAFRQVGEGYAETVLRVASGIDVAGLALERFGIAAISYTDIANKQGDVAAEIVRQSILATRATGGVADIMRTLGGSASELADTYGELLVAQESMRMVGIDPDRLGVGMIRSAGGLDKLQGGFDDYFEGFFTEAEQVAAKTEVMRSKFAALGVQMPESIQAFRAIVETSPALTGQLITLAGSFADLMEMSKSDALELSNEQRSMEAQILRLQGNELKAVEIERALELEGMHASLQPLQQRIWLLEDEAAAQAEAAAAWERQRTVGNAARSIEARRLELTGDSLKALAIRRDLELEGIDASLHAAQKHVWALEDQAAASQQAADAAKKLASEQTALQDRLDAATMSPSALAEKRREAIDPGLRALYDQVIAAEALTGARTALTSAYQAESDAIKATTDRMAGFARTLRGLRDSTLLGNLSPLTPMQKYQEARAQYERTVAAARGGDEAAQGRYADAYSAFLEASQLVNASGAQYQQDFAFAQAATEEAAKWAEMQVDVGQASLEALKAQVAGLIDVQGAVLTVRDAVNNLSALLIAAGQPVPTGGQGNAIESIYKSVLGRQADPAGMEFWTKQLQAGISIRDITEAFKRSDEYLMQQAPIRAQDYGTGASTALVAEIKSLREENGSMRAELKGLRDDLRKQTGDQIQAEADISDRSTNKLTAALTDVVRAVGQREPSRVAPV